MSKKITFFFENDWLTIRNWERVPQAGEQVGLVVNGEWRFFLVGDVMTAESGEMGEVNYRVSLKSEILAVEKEHS